MNDATIDGTVSTRLTALGRRVLEGGELTREEGRWLFHLTEREDIFELMH